MTTYRDRMEATQRQRGREEQARRVARLSRIAECPPAAAAWCLVCGAGPRAVCSCLTTWEVHGDGPWPPLPGPLSGVEGPLTEAQAQRVRESCGRMRRLAWCVDEDARAGTRRLAA